MTTTGVPSDVAAAVDGLIWAALTAVGNRLRRSRLCPRSERWWAFHTEPAALHTRLRIDEQAVDDLKLTDGVWSRVPEIAGRYDIEPGCLEVLLDEYVRELVAAGVAYDYRQVPALLRRATCLTEADYRAGPARRRGGLRGSDGRPAAHELTGGVGNR